MKYIIVERLALEDYRYLHSTRGELLRRLGRSEEARDAYRCALALARATAGRARDVDCRVDLFASS